MKKKTPAQMFSCEYCKILKNSFFIEHLWWLLLQMHAECFFEMAIFFYYTFFYKQPFYKQLLALGT